MTDEKLRGPDPVALADFLARVRADAPAVEPAADDPIESCFLDIDPAIPGSLVASTVWFRFSCLAVAGGPCPAWRLSQCRSNCWRRPKRTVPAPDAN